MTQHGSNGVAVTGLGVVSGWGWGVDRFWRGICATEPSIRPLRRFDTTGYFTHLAAEVQEQPKARLLDAIPDRRTSSLADRFAILSVIEALESAGLSDLSGQRVGVYLGSSTGGLLESEEFFLEAGKPLSRKRGIRRLSQQQVCSPATAVARAIGATGPVRAVSAACASGTIAVGTALHALREGTADIAVAGGSDSLCRVTFGGFNALRAVDDDPCRPFREERNGLSLGEGAGALVMESQERARARGARILAELRGFGTAADARHMTAPDPEGSGAALALRRALDDAGMSASDLDFVNAHGTGTPLNDAAEFRALEQVLGPERARTVPLTSTKGSIGHLLGSAGAVEAVATVLCLEKRCVHPTPGEGTVAAEAPVNLVRGRPRRSDALRAGVSLSLGFGGCNGAVIFCRR